MGRKRSDKSEEQQYEEHREASAARSAVRSRAGRDIGEIPPVSDPARRAEGEGSFRRFCEIYFGEVFSLAWSADHLRVIAKIEDAVLRGGLFALAMPRGSGKSSLAETACVWAVLCGHRRFVVLVGAEETSAESMLDSIKTELETNDLLHEDYPEACYPIARLEGIAHRCNGQLYQGERTHITWTAKELILPTIPGSKASGAILKVAGITGRIRGMKHKRPDGQAVRPELVIIDDPQTDESSRSRSQCETRERILAGAILGLAGPGRKIAGVMPCTVISPGDVADTILDRQKHPEWQGVRTKLLYSFPTNMALWERYGEVRAESMRAGGKGEEATDFYRDNREAMDEGAVVAWAERHHPDELSAIQHAMNWWLTDPRAFAAEGNNEPLAETTADAETMTAEEVADRVNGMARGLVPVGGSHVTAFIDVQASMLFWAAVAWADDFSGWLLDYGTWPDQGVERFTLRDPRVTLADVFPSMGEEGRIRAALERLTADLCGRAWRRDDGAEVRVERLMVDAGYQADVVYQHCRTSPFAAILLPSHGKYIGAESTPMDQYRKNQGDRVGPSWRIPVGSGRRSIRHAIFDSNHWKTFVFARLATALGDHGSLSLFGSKPAAHRLLSEHLTAEYRVRVSAKGREIDVWKLRTEKPDNHWFDCCVGAAIGASIQGVALAGMESRAALAGPRQRVSFAEMQRAKRGRR